MSKALSFQSAASVVLAVGKGNKHSKADSDEIKEMDGKDEGDSIRNNAKTENETRAPSRSVEPTSYLSGEATRLWVDRGVVGVPIKRGMTSTTPQPFDLGPRQSFQDLSQEMARRAHSRKELSSELASRQSSRPHSRKELSSELASRQRSSEDRPRTGMSMRTGPSASASASRGPGPEQGPEQGPDQGPGRGPGQQGGRVPR